MGEKSELQQQLEHLKEIRIEDEDGEPLVEIELVPEMVSFDREYEFPGYGRGSLADGKRKASIRIEDADGIVTAQLKHQLED